MFALEPNLVAVSCERIKQKLWRELGSPPSCQGKVFVSLYPATKGNQPIRLASVRFADGWQYRMELPQVIERSRYLQAVVQAVLLEIANRNAGTRSAEVPLWLSAGFAQDLLVSSESEIILPPPGAAHGRQLIPATFINTNTGNPLTSTHEYLRTHPPLNFDQLSWPADTMLTGEAGKLYRTSALVFLHELLGLPGGQASLRVMLDQLPQYYNWQLAMLHAFPNEFQRTRDIDKWWSLHSLYFTGHELSQAWPLEDSLDKLDRALRTSADIRTGTNELPLQADITLQTIIRDWEPERQTEALQATLHELELLRLRTALPLIGLLDEYRQTLSTFLQDRDHTGFLGLRKKALQRRMSEDAIRQLDALDARRAALRNRSPESRSSEPLAAGR
jgi:hypothetical protein